MSSKILIGVDVMGGNNAPDAAIQAIASFLNTADDVYFHMYGKKSIILPKIIHYKMPEDGYKILDCEEVISDEDKPIEAVRNGKNSSMRKAIEALKYAQVHSVISCGNTGALMLNAKMLLGTLPNIKRPAIVGVFPTIGNNKTVLLDLGANLECAESNIFHFALMGSCFAKILLEKENPSIGMLNVGVEKNKGRELEQQSYKILEKSGLNFLGFVEGHDIVKGNVDVIVTDGFSGNIFLKASEGAANACMELIKYTIGKGGIVKKLATYILKSSMKEFFKVIDPNKNNGAMFIGLNGIVIKSHGSASVEGIHNAINTAYMLTKDNINAKISKELELFEAKGTGLNFVDKIKQTSAKILGMTE